MLFVLQLSIVRTRFDKIQHLVDKGSRTHDQAQRIILQTNQNIEILPTLNTTERRGDSPTDMKWRIKILLFSDDSSASKCAMINKINFSAHLLPKTTNNSSEFNERSDTDKWIFVFNKSTSSCCYERFSKRQKLSFQISSVVGNITGT